MKPSYGIQILAGVFIITAAILTPLTQDFLDKRKATQNDPERNNPSQLNQPEFVINDGWSNEQIGVLNQAPRNGFIVVSSVGSNPLEKADIKTGFDKTNLILRARIGVAFSSAVVPVSRGEYWKVKAWNKYDGQLLIQFKAL